VLFFVHIGTGKKSYLKHTAGFSVYFEQCLTIYGSSNSEDVTHPKVNFTPTPSDPVAELNFRGQFHQR